MYKSDFRQENDDLASLAGKLREQVINMENIEEIIIQNIELMIIGNIQ